MRRICQVSFLVFACFINSEPNTICFFLKQRSLIYKISKPHKCISTFTFNTYNTGPAPTVTLQPAAGTADSCLTFARSSIWSSDRRVFPPWLCLLRRWIAPCLVVWKGGRVTAPPTGLMIPDRHHLAADSPPHLFVHRPNDSMAICLSLLCYYDGLK